MELLESLKKNKSRLINTGVIIIAFMIAFNIYRNQIMETQSWKEKAVAQKNTNDELLQISELETALDSYRKILPQEEVNTIMNNIASIARESGITILSWRPLNSEKGELLDKIPFDLSVQAKNYDALGVFISRLESFREIYYTVESVMVNHSRDTNETADERRLSVLLKVAALYIRQ